MRVESLEQRNLLSADVPFTAPQRDALVDGLHQFAAYSEKLEEYSAFGQSLPLVDSSIGETLDLGGIVYTN